MNRADIPLEQEIETELMAPTFATAREMWRWMRPQQAVTEPLAGLH